MLCCGSVESCRGLREHGGHLRKIFHALDLVHAGSIDLESSSLSVSLF